MGVKTFLNTEDNPWAKNYALKYLCRAVERGHPAAFSELGNLFWHTGTSALGQSIPSYIFEEDNVKACFWYSMANGKVQPPWCYTVLTVEETETVEHLIDNRQPGQCKRETDKILSMN